MNKYIVNVKCITHIKFVAYFSFYSYNILKVLEPIRNVTFLELKYQN